MGASDNSDHESGSQTSPLLNRLPAELRNKIYRLVLVSESRINIVVEELKECTSMLRTCKQIEEGQSFVSKINNVKAGADYIGKLQKPLRSSTLRMSSKSLR